MTGPWIAAFLVLWLTCLVTLLVVLGQARRFAGLFEAVSAYLSSEAGQAQLESIAPGEIVDDFDIRDSKGHTSNLKDLIDSRTIILFVSDECAPCVDLLEELSTDGTIAGVPTLLISTSEVRVPSISPSAHDQIYLDPEGAAMKAFRNKVTPRAFLVEKDGLVLDKEVPNLVRQLHALVRRNSPMESVAAGSVARRGGGDSSPS